MSHTAIDLGFLLITYLIGFYCGYMACLVVRDRGNP